MVCACTRLLTGKLVSMPEFNVALWEPDITPPFDWLLPSILYQEKISTIAPLYDVSDRYGREARQLSETLGKLYEPLSLSNILYPPPNHEALISLLQGRLPFWIRRMEQLLDRTGDHFIRSWLGRVIGWHDRRAGLNAAVRETAAAESAVREQVKLEEERLRSLNAEVATLQHEVENMRSAVQEELIREKAKRRAPYEETLERRSALITPEGRWGRDPDTDTAIRRIDADLKRIQRNLQHAPRSKELQSYDRARARLATAVATQGNAHGRLRITNGQLTEARRRSERAREAEAVPWREDSRLQPWLEPENLAEEVPAFLDAIWPGKVYGELFEFLASEAGMWVSQRKRTPYDEITKRVPEAEALVGPRWVIEEVLSIVAEWYCASHDGWVSMSAATRPYDHVGQELRTPEELVTLGIRWLLPTPVNATLADALNFRLKHEEELRVVRDALSDALPDLTNLEELGDAIRVIRTRIAEPLSAIERAMKLERSVTLRKTEQTVLYRAGSGLRNLAAAIAAAGVAAPVLGNTLSSTGLIATLGGGAVLTVTGLTAQHVYSRVALDRARRDLQNSPYRYLYEVGRRFDFAR